MTYSEKLKDPRWQRKRLEILERDGWACTLCEDATSTLQVHHRKYTAGDPWDAADDDLETLCEKCHEEITKNLKSLRKSISFLTFGTISIVAGFSKAVVQDYEGGDLVLENAEEVLGFSMYHGVKWDDPHRIMGEGGVIRLQDVPAWRKAVKK